MTLEYEYITYEGSTYAYAYDSSSRYKPIYFYNYNCSSTDYIKEDEEFIKEDEFKI